MAYILKHKIIVTGKILKIAGPRDAWFEHVENPEVLVKNIVAAKIGADIFTFWQTLPDTKPLYDYFFEWDNVAAIPVQGYDHWLNKQVAKNTRKAIKKSLKLGLVVTEAELDDVFCEKLVKIYNETPVRQGRRFSLYGADKEMIRSGLSDQLESSVFLGAFHGEELIGYIKLIKLKNYVRATGTLTSTLHRDKPAMNLLIAKAVEYCALHNFPYLTYGRFTYGNKGADSLSDFKRHNGFEKIDVPRYYIPLTLKGKFALRTGLHRDMISILPTNLYQFLIKLRSKWYAESGRGFNGSPSQ